MLDRSGQVSGSMPEKTLILKNKDGSDRIVIVAQMWKLEKGTYCTSAIFGPIEMSDDDARWMAEQYTQLFRSMDLYR